VDEGERSEVRPALDLRGRGWLWSQVPPMLGSGSPGLALRAGDALPSVLVTHGSSEEPLLNRRGAAIRLSLVHNLGACGRPERWRAQAVQAVHRPLQVATDSHPIMPSPATWSTATARRRTLNVDLRLRLDSAAL
jgi:hypothetical protein